MLQFLKCTGGVKVSLKIMISMVTNFQMKVISTDIMGLCLLHPTSLGIDILSRLGCFISEFCKAFSFLFLIGLPVSPTAWFHAQIGLCSMFRSIYIVFHPFHICRHVFHGYHM
ncbi:hypothetical protein Dimus_001286 [Dionaea muscipula]